jgi:hypothetical protein
MQDRETDLAAGRAARLIARVEHLPRGAAGPLSSSARSASGRRRATPPATTARPPTERTLSSCPRARNTSSPSSRPIPSACPNRADLPTPGGPSTTSARRPARAVNELDRARARRHARRAPPSPVADDPRPTRRHLASIAPQHGAVERRDPPSKRPFNGHGHDPAISAPRKLVVSSPGDPQRLFSHQAQRPMRAAQGGGRADDGCSPPSRSASCAGGLVTWPAVTRRPRRRCMIGVEGPSARLLAGGLGAVAVPLRGRALTLAVATRPRRRRGCARGPATCRRWRF